MTNIELFEKVSRVIMSCNTEQQLNVAIRYVRLSQKKLTHEWNMDIIHLMTNKERELACL
jgi:hypothetical protein